MRLSDGLKQRRGDLLDRLESLSKKAEGESRLFTADEAAAWDAATASVRDLDQQIERQVAAEEMARSGKGGQRIAVDDAGNRHPVLTTGMKLADRHPPRGGQTLDLAKTIRGIVTGNWDGADGEQRAMSVGSLPGGGYSVPLELSSMWIDLARARAVTIAAGAGTVVMDSMTLRIASIVGDVAPAFRPENTALPENDVVFGALDFKARLIGVVTRSSLELISDAPNASEMITASITGALGVGMDAAMLSGSGDVATDTPRGILNWPGINTIPTVGTPTNYDAWLDAIHAIELANLEPSAVADNPDTVNVLRKLKTGISGDQTPLRAPAAYAALAPFVTTGLATGNSIVGDFTNALFGMRESIVIEATRVGDTALKNAQILIRGYMRIDTGVTRPKAFAALTGITTT
jgi:HK97 family phage major capsid protein